MGIKATLGTSERCPRCGGNIRREYEMMDKSWDLACLQCGFRDSATPRPPVSLTPPARPDRSPRLRQKRSR